MTFSKQSNTIMETYLCYMDGGAVAIVKSQTLENFGRDLGVLLHSLPQVGTVLGRLAIIELHTISPGHELSPQVHITTFKDLQKHQHSVKFNRN